MRCMNCCDVCVETLARTTSRNKQTNKQTSLKRSYLQGLLSFCQVVLLPEKNKLLAFVMIEKSNRLLRYFPDTADSSTSSVSGLVIQLSDTV